MSNINLPASSTAQAPSRMALHPAVVDLDQVPHPHDERGTRRRPAIRSLASKSSVPVRRTAERLRTARCAVAGAPILIGEPASTTSTRVHAVPGARPPQWGQLDIRGAVIRPATACAQARGPICPQQRLNHGVGGGLRGAADVSDPVSGPFHRVPATSLLLRLTSFLGSTLALISWRLAAGRRSHR